MDGPPGEGAAHLHETSQPLAQQASPNPTSSVAENLRDGDTDMPSADITQPNDSVPSHNTSLPDTDPEM